MGASEGVLSDDMGKGGDETRIELLEEYPTEKGLGRRTSHQSRRRPSRKMWLVATLLLLVFGASVWAAYLRPQWQEEWEYKQGFLATEDQMVEIGKKKHFDGVRVQKLDSKLVPGGDHDPQGRRRLVFVGDIHGCADELKHLLKKIGYDEKYDHLIPVGDVVSKGPQNVEVLDELIRLKASSVRGNHEDSLLRRAVKGLDLEDSSADDEVAIESRKKKKKDKALLRKFSKHHLSYLRDMPLMIRIPALPQADKPTAKDGSPIAEEIVVVHAGLVPAIPLDKQDPYLVMNMRSIRWKTHTPQVEAKAHSKKSKPWFKLWEWYNDRVYKKKSLKDFRAWDDEVSQPAEDMDTEGDGWFENLLPTAESKSKRKPQVVVYGHHSKAGLKLSRWSKGLDAGCVSGGRLTAMVLDARGRQEIVNVGCKDHR